MLQELLVRPLARLDGLSTTSVLLGTLISPTSIGPPKVIQGPSVVFQTPSSSLVPSIAPPRFIALSIFACATMSLFE